MFSAIRQMSSLDRLIVVRKQAKRQIIYIHLCNLPQLDMGNLYY